MVKFQYVKKIQKYLSYLHTIKHLSDFRGIFHFEEGAQVSSSIEKLYLKTFVSKSDFTADKVIIIIKIVIKVTGVLVSTMSGKHETIA